MVQHDEREGGREREGERLLGNREGGVPMLALWGLKINRNMKNVCIQKKRRIRARTLDN
jgi:hypothetical protein